jgi:hypothetical protein
MRERNVWLDGLRQFGEKAHVLGTVRTVAQPLLAVRLLPLQQSSPPAALSQDVLCYLPSS